MQSHLILIRAIGTEFVIRKFRTLFIILGIIFAVLLIVSVWLTTLNGWWGILLFLVLCLIFMVSFLVIGARIMMAVVRPAMDPVQTSAVKAFVNKLERVAENLQTPLPWIVFKVLWMDVVRPREPGYLQGILHDNTTLRSDYENLRKQF